jgi:predicted N-acyltransferase
MHLELFDRHLSADELASSGYKFVPRRTFEIDLTKSHDQLLASMTQGCRRNIRKAERAGVQVEVATDYDFASQYFEQLGDVFSKQRLARPYGIERVAGLLRNMLPHGNLLLLRALDPNGHCVATGIFPTANKTMYFWGGASWREHHHLRPNQILHWVAIMCAKARGIERYDMGGGGDYKRQYGGRQIAVPWVTVSKYPGLHLLRSCARLAWDIRQRALGIAGTSTGRLP